MKLLWKFLSRCLCFCFGPRGAGMLSFIRNSKAVFESARWMLSYNWTSGFRHSAFVSALDTVRSFWLCMETCRGVPLQCQWHPVPFPCVYLSAVLSLFMNEVCALLSKIELKEICYLFMWMCMSIRCLRRPDSGTRFEGSEVTGGCGPPNIGVGNHTPVLGREQQLVLTTESSL